MYKNILVPILVDDEHNAETSFQAAQALADENASFTILHVMESIPGYVVSQLPEELLNKSKAQTEEALEKASAALPGSKTQLISGHAGRSIVDYASENDIDCIVIESHQPGIEDFFLGSTASRVVRHAACAVHVIR